MVQLTVIQEYEIVVKHETDSGGRIKIVTVCCIASYRREREREREREKKK